MKKVLVTGANGFVGRNLCASLACNPELTVLKYDVDNTANELAKFVNSTDFVFHLAGVNRPNNPEDFKTGNAGFTEQMLALLRATGRNIPVVLSSSTQAALDNPYGISKRQAEESVFAYGQETGAAVFVYRLPNVFGKWCRPNYNSAVATWCHNVARGLPIEVRDPFAPLTLVYVDDVVNEFLSVLFQLNVKQSPADTSASPRLCVYKEIAPTYTRTLGHITDLLHAFKRSRTDLQIPDQGDGFTKKLYATYLSALPENQFSYPLKMNVDARGSFTEFLKTPDKGQVSVNVSKPGIAKGNHWHHTKVEKFLVVSGKGVIRFRKVAGETQRRDADTQRECEIVEYVVSGEKLEVIDIPPGYTHNIENIGNTDMVTVMWANELLDPNKPDTFFEKV
jgi:UDP-2-acetamido-2,6-beta-L-arabino-hexul-4-ose reductase